MFWGFFALQLTDRVLAPNLAFSEGTMVLWQEKKRKKEREREIRGGKLMGSVEVREEERRGEEGWDGKATHNLEFTANVLRPIWAKFVSDPALNYKIPTSLYLPPSLPSSTSFPPTSSYSFFFFLGYPSLFHSASCICSTFGCTQRSTLSVSFIFSSCLFITVRMGFVSYHEAVKTRASPPRGWLSESKVRREGRLAVCCFSLNFSS